LPAINKFTNVGDVGVYNTCDVWLDEGAPATAVEPSNNVAFRHKLVSFNDDEDGEPKDTNCEVTDDGVDVAGSFKYLVGLYTHWNATRVDPFPHIGSDIGRHADCNCNAVVEMSDDNVAVVPVASNCKYLVVSFDGCKYTNEPLLIVTDVTFHSHSICNTEPSAAWYTEAPLVNINDEYRNPPYPSCENNCTPFALLLAAINSLIIGYASITAATYNELLTLTFVFKSFNVTYQQNWPVVDVVGTLNDTNDPDDVADMYKYLLWSAFHWNATWYDDAELPHTGCVTGNHAHKSGVDEHVDDDANCTVEPESCEAKNFVVSAIGIIFT